MHLAVGILRVQEGLDYTGVIEEEDQKMEAPVTRASESEKEIVTVSEDQSDNQLSNGKRIGEVNMHILTT